MKLKVASLSAVGQVRQNNEDAFGHFEPDDAKELKQKGRLFLVADGMGGHKGGAIASELAVEAIRQYYYSSDAKDRAAVLKRALKHANRVVFDKSEADDSLTGMGTTCTAMLILEGNAYFAHVGDSRAYIYRDEDLVQITQDHSLVGEMVRSGIITAEDARNHPKRNVITRSLGVQEEITADTPNSPFELKKGDVLVLCSDGLTSFVGNEEIKKTIAANKPATASKKLVDLANDQGGKDNITVIVVEVSEV
jgi:protein phosphatase